MENEGTRAADTHGASALRAISQVFWPPAAPWDAPPESAATWWAAACALCVIPFTAVLHHAVFCRPTCMMNNFGPDYTPRVVWAWLSRDPSLPWAVLLALASHRIGRRLPGFKVLIAPVFLSFLPLSLWVWDIPFTGRTICHHFHDRRVLLAAGMPLKSSHFYLIGIILYLAFLAHLMRRRGRADRPG